MPTEWRRDRRLGVLPCPESLLGEAHSTIRYGRESCLSVGNLSKFVSLFRSFLSLQFKDWKDEINLGLCVVVYSEKQTAKQTAVGLAA